MPQRNVATWEFAIGQRENVNVETILKVELVSVCLVLEATRHALDMENAYRWLNLQFNPPNIPMVQRAHLRMVEPQMIHIIGTTINCTVVSVTQDITATIARKGRVQKGTIQ